MRASIELPVIDRLIVRDFALYPGSDKRGIDLVFEDREVTVLAGINGIGKTTLLQLLIRMLVGATNPAKAATRDLGRAGDRSLATTTRFTYFAKRVPDISDAVATLYFHVGDSKYVVKRSLRNLQIEAFTDGREKHGAIGNADFLEHVRTRCGFFSAYDYHIVVRYLQFFTEDRLPMLWSPTTQFELFRALFGDAAVSKRISSLSQEIQRLDSDYRNRTYQLNERRKRLIRPVIAGERQAREALQALEAKLPGIMQLRVDLDKRTQDDERATTDALDQISLLEASLETSSSRLSQADATYISQALPTLDGKLSWLMQGLGNNVGCFLCGTKGKRPAVHIKKRLRTGHCFVCSERIRVLGAVAPVAAAEIDALSEDIALKAQQLAKLRKQVEAQEQRRAERIAERVRAARAESDTRAQIAAIRMSLPDEPEDSSAVDMDLEQAEIDALDEQRSHAVGMYRKQITAIQKSVGEKAEDLAARFTRYAREFLAEEVSVKLERDTPFKIATGAPQVKIPAFQLAMTSGAHRAPTPRETVDTVSESQKEFLDLAFRMALLEVINPKGSSMLVVETPEASLDTWFMQQAATMMRAFAIRPHRKLVATSNLNGTQMIPNLLGLANGARLASADGHRLVNLMALGATPAVLREAGARKAYEAELRSYLRAR